MSDDGDGNGDHVTPPAGDARLQIEKDFFVHVNIDIPAGGYVNKKIEMFFGHTSIDSYQATTTIQTMFSFLKTGDINNTIRGLTNLPGLFNSDGDKIKYALLNHSTAMRTNLLNGEPIFMGIREWETEFEQRNIQSIITGRLPSMAAEAVKRRSPFTDNNDLRIDNAALAFIMAKELAFLNRTIQMITLIANRYQEEQEDLEWGRSPRCDDDDDDDDDDVMSPLDQGQDLEQCYDDDSVPSILQRSHSHPTNEYYCNDGNGSSSTPRKSRNQNQLVATFLIASGRLQRSFNELCDLTEAGGGVLVNGMTTMDRPHNEANKAKQLIAQSYVISNIFLHFEKFDAQHREPVVSAFLQLRDISVNAWRVMSMYAFSNLFRLTAGTDFAVYQPDDAIFTQGRDYHIHHLRYEEAAVMRFAEAEAEVEAEVPSYD
jgi:hypothetical protein